MTPIKKKLHDLSLNKVGLEKNVAEYLLSYTGDYRTLKAKEIMDKCFVSMPTITRTAKNVDLHGFNELKIYLYEETKTSSDLAIKYQGAESSDYFIELNETIKVLSKTIDEQTIQNIVNLFDSNSKINIYSQGGTNLLMKDFNNKLLRLNFHTTCMSDYHHQTVQAKNSDLNTISIGVSYSGLTVEVLDNLNSAKQNNSKTVLVTSNSDVIKYKFIDYLIIVPTTESIYRNFSMTSRFSILAIFDLMYIKIINSNYKKYTQILEHNKYF